jgi:hypothetical protein
MILTQVLPVGDDIIRKITDGVLARDGGGAPESWSILEIELLPQMQPNDIPAFITPEEVILGLLHTQPTSPFLYPNIAKYRGLFTNF